MDTQNVTLEDIRDLALDLKSKIDKLEMAILKTPNARVLDAPKQVNDTLTKVNVRFDPEVEGFKYGNLLCKLNGKSLMNLKKNDEIFYVGRPNVREYNGKKYCDVWVSSFKVVSSAPAPVQQPSFQDDTEVEF